MKEIVIDGVIYTAADLERIKADAIAEWHKASKAINRAEARQRRAEGVARMCTARLRLLRMI